MSKPTILNHSYQHFDDLQLSAKEFYAMLEALIKEYQYPDVVFSTLAMRESGLMSTKREYLRVYKAPYSYWICAAPFGRSFFISWWLDSTQDPLIALLQKLPLIGRIFGPYAKSYFTIDTELIFTKSIDSIVRAAIQKIAAEHGFRQPDLPLED